MSTATLIGAKEWGCCWFSGTQGRRAPCCLLATHHASQALTGLVLLRLVSDVFVSSFDGDAEEPQGSRRDVGEDWATLGCSPLSLCGFARAEREPARPFFIAGCANVEGGMDASVVSLLLPGRGSVGGVCAIAIRSCVLSGPE